MEILINIDVDDLAKAETFYREAFGLTRGRRLGDGAIEMLGGPSPIYLLRKSPGSAPFPGTSLEREYGRHWTPVHLDFVVEQLDTALARAMEAGAALQEEVTTASWGHMAQLADPFGHGFCLVEFTATGYDEIAEPERQEQRP